MNYKCDFDLSQPVLWPHIEKLIRCHEKKEQENILIAEKRYYYEFHLSD